MVVLTNISYLLTSVLVTTSLTLTIIPVWVRIAFSRGFTGKDMNKLGDVRVAEGGGLWVVISCTFGIYLLATLHRYLSNEVVYNDEFFALTSLLLLTSLLGFMDDILGWKKGLPIWVRVLFIAPISIPLIVIKAGVSTVSIPLVGVVDFGILYPLVLVPVGVLGAANAFNMIAGYNGLEASMGLTLMLFTAIFSYVKGIDLVFECSLIMASALAAFLRFNWYPAKVFPGNTLTYAVGAYYASLVILGNMEKFGVLLYTLYFIEFILFIRGIKDGIYKENFGIPEDDGTLKQPYSKVYSLTHLAIVILGKLGIKPTEVRVTLTLTSLQVLVGMVVLAVTLLGLI
ncbi:MAG: glycosyl transferase family 4 [Desulfurococcaceae archaeon]|nr:glycosyl transferase family 4 [Desulfurococcaceae archaeon]